METEISKKDEIINIASELFFSKGYSNTSIQNIIDKADIAKGTFYHYFKSKDDLLNEMTKKHVSNLYPQLHEIIKMEISAIEKLNMLFQSTSNWKSLNIEFMKLLTKAVYSDSNIVLRNKLLEETIKQISPLYLKIINQGIKEGVFEVEDPGMTAQFILTSFTSNSEEMSKYLLADKYNQEVIDGLKRTLSFSERMVERMLGAEKNSLHFVEVEVLERLIKGLLEA